MLHLIMLVYFTLLCVIVCHYGIWTPDDISVNGYCHNILWATVGIFYDAGGVHASQLMVDTASQRKRVHFGISQ